MRLLRAFTPALIIALLLSSSIAYGQNIVTGAVSGVITDPSGAVVSGNTVMLADTATGEVRMTTTDEGGRYLFSLLKPGTYKLMLERTGFHQANQSVDVLLGQTTTANVRLELRGGSETVNVTTTDELLQKEDGNITSNINLKTIENIPNPGGDLTNYAQLAPGIMMNTSSIFGFGNFSVFGLPGTSNLFSINGNDYNDPFVNVNNAGSSNLLLGSNEIQEVAIVSNGYTGQYGRQAGAQVNYSTKSGENAFHGDAVYQWNGSSLNANDYFLDAGGVPKPFENNNQWAASFGGPIKKDKAFFFVDTEGIRYVFGTATQVFVPDPALESYTIGNLNAVSPAAVPFYQQMFALYNAAPGISRAVQVPTGPDANDNSCGSLGGAPGTPFATQPCLDSFFTSSSNGNQEEFVSARVDYNFSDSDKVFARVKFDRGLQPTYTDPINPVFNVQAKQPQDEGQLNYTHVFGPRVVNSVIGSVLYTSSIFQDPNEQAALQTFPYIYLPIDTNLTPLGIAGSTYPAVAPYPSGRNLTQWQLVDDLSIERNKHVFKMGVNFRRDDISDWTASTGSFPVVQSILADFTSDIVDEIGQHFTNDPVEPLAYYSLGLYFQDEYRVNSKLKLTLALRADRNSNGICRSDCASRAVVPFTELDHDETIPYNEMMSAGQSQILPGIESIVFEPRVGFAWSAFGNTVIRGGAGLFSDMYPGLLLDYFTRNFPEVTSFTLVNDYSTNNYAMSPAEANSAAALINGCNKVFQSNYNAGGTLAGFQGAAPAGCQTPNLNDIVDPLQVPKYLEWNLEVQHPFGSQTMVSANYVGNHGYDELLINPYLNGFGYATLPATAPDPRVSNVLEFTSAGISNYNGLTLSVQRQFRKGFQGSLNYTYSHSLDDVSNGGLLPYSLANSLQYQINPLDPRLNYASSDYDLRHYLSANYVWDLPMKSNNESLNAMLGGWTVSGTLFVHSGFPFSIVDGATEAANAGQNLAGGTVLAQPVAPIPATCTSLNPANPCYVASDFATSTGFGGGRNAYRGPGYFDTDLSLRKSFKLSERTGMMVGANFYNILNHPNFANPDSNLADSGAGFGVINSTVEQPTSPYGAAAQAATDARIVQLIAKLTF